MVARGRNQWLAWKLGRNSLSVNDCRGLPPYRRSFVPSYLGVYASVACATYAVLTNVLNNCKVHLVVRKNSIADVCAAAHLYYEEKLTLGALRPTVLSPNEEFTK